MEDYKEVAQLGLTFLGRTDLKGAEITNLQRVANMLGNIAEGVMVLGPPQEPKPKPKKK